MGRYKGNLHYRSNRSPPPNPCAHQGRGPCRTDLARCCRGRGPGCTGHAPRRTDLIRGLRVQETRHLEVHSLRGNAILIPANVLNDCVWRNVICYTNALILLVWPDRIVIFVAHNANYLCFCGNQIVSNAVRIVSDLVWVVCPCYT
jgi:hypothetical protein